MAPMLHSYLPIVLMIFVAAGLGGAIVFLSYIFSPRFKSSSKDVPYESGFVPLRDARDRFNVRFCIVAILFLIFDVEAAFIFPWAIFFKQAILKFSPLLIIGEMFLFIFILLFGLFYVYKRGGLNWE